MENTKLSNLSISDLYATKQYLLYYRDEYEDVSSHKDFCEVRDDFYYTIGQVNTELLKKIKNIDFGKEKINFLNEIIQDKIIDNNLEYLKTKKANQLIQKCLNFLKESIEDREESYSIAMANDKVYYAKKSIENALIMLQSKK